MLPKKEDRIGENLWDEPVKASKESHFKTVRATPLHRIIHLVVDVTATFVLFQLVQVSLYLFSSSLGISVEHVTKILSNQFTLPIAYLLLVFIFETITKGQSIGKLITGFRAQRTDEKVFEPKNAFLRTLCRLIPLEFLWIFFRKDRRALHDVLSSTEIRLKPKTVSPRKDDVIFD